MTIRWIFHALAALSGIIATACGLLSSQNKLTLIIVFSIITATFELAIPFLKLKPIEIPKPKFSITTFPTNYQKGVIVDGIEWQVDFKQYLFRFKNESLIAEMNDLRIDIDLNGGIVKKEIELQQGCESISLSQTNISDFGIGNIDAISKTVKTYVNNAKINAGKVHPEGYFDAKFIVKVIDQEKKDVSIPPGYLFIDYRYKNENGKSDKKSIAFPIRYKSAEKRVLFIDESKPLKGSIKRSIQMIPEKPIILEKSGKVRIKEDT